MSWVCLEQHRPGSICALSREIVHGGKTSMATKKKAKKKKKH
jgi:hypothetical protein